MPLGSSSDAPVMRPGPKTFSNFGCAGFLKHPADWREPTVSDHSSYILVHALISNTRQITSTYLLGGSTPESQCEIADRTGGSARTLHSEAQARNAPACGHPPATPLQRQSTRRPAAPAPTSAEAGERAEPASASWLNEAGVNGRRRFRKSGHLKFPSLAGGFVSVISRDGDRAFPLLAGGRAVSARAVG